MSHNQRVMSRWMRESLNALQQLRSERDHHERALEAAMEAIRFHTQAVERLEQDIEIIETAVACTSEEPASVEVTELAPDDEFETAALTEVRHISEVVRPPSPPPLRPVPMHAVGQR
ncbi:MAG: hypothetical protein KDK70_28095 [Myxococcales bacterium]|nr:hypothetical protein [Myxococcales bacterium]